MWDSNPRNPRPKRGGIAANRTRDKIGAPGWNRTTTLALQERTSTTKDTRAKLVRPEGFEPPTPTFVALCSVQMSYGRILNLLK